MNRNERNRMTLMARVKQRALTLVAAAGLLGLGYRQTKRVWQRYRTQGDAGLVHRSRGQPSPHRTAPAVRQRVLVRCAERYPDFGPTLAAEYLRQEGLVVDHETLRRWQIATVPSVLPPSATITSTSGKSIRGCNVDSITASSFRVGITIDTSPGSIAGSGGVKISAILRHASRSSG